MRIRISADSATEKQLRMLLAAIAKVGKAGTTEVGLDGPECYNLQTTHLTPHQFARVVGEVVMVDEHDTVDAFVTRHQQAETVSIVDAMEQAATEYRDRE